MPDEMRSHGAQATPSTPMVVLSGVERSFPRPGGGRLVALSVDSLVVPRGVLWALTGPNGTGKTTLLHVVSGLLRPDRGGVTVGGARIDGLPEATLDLFRARNVGYLLQGGQLMDSLTAEENVMAAMLFAGRSAAEQRRRAAELLDQLGVAHRARHLPGALSGGERQRVALARALANRPPLVLADEPLASLDAPATATLGALFHTLVAEGLTLLVASHQPERLDPQGVTELTRPASEGGAP
ncbi:MAG: ATP-binding cassette domain-containing protein [Pseudomonadota bacterium]